MALPIINLDDKTYQELVNEALARIPVYAPEWTDHNAHDPGITFIELFAWLIEMQLYRLNRLSRSTRKKLLRLINIRCLPAQPAGVTLTFELLGNTSTTVKKGTQVAAVDPITHEDIILKTDEEIIVLKDHPVTVHAVQYRTVSQTFTSSGLPNYNCALSHSPVIENTVVVRVREDYTWHTWQKVDDFDASKPGDRHYIIDHEKGLVTFGDGLHGMVPPKGGEDNKNIDAAYRATVGKKGNVPSGTINKILDSNLINRVKVNNEQAAGGGTEPETLEQAIYRAQRELKKIVRAVTSEDYEHLVRNTPGIRVARVKAIPGYHRSQPRVVPGIVTVVVIPEHAEKKPLPDKDFIKAVYRHLDIHRMLTTEVFVMPPEYIEVSIVTSIEIKKESDPEKVRKNVKESLGKFLHPLTGWTDGSGWPFGRPVYISEIYEVIESVEGVDFVRTLTIKSNNTEYDRELVIPPYGLVCSGKHEITV